MNHFAMNLQANLISADKYAYGTTDTVECLNKWKSLYGNTIPQLTYRHFIHWSVL